MGSQAFSLGLQSFLAYAGPVGFILLLLSIYSITLIIRKALTFWRAGLNRTGAFETALERFEVSGPDAAIKALGRDAHPISEMLRTGAELTRLLIGRTSASASGTIADER